MRSIVYTPDKNHPRIVIELRCDLELLVACIKDGEIDPAQVGKQLNEAMKKIVEALHKGLAKKKAEEEE